MAFYLLAVKRPMEGVCILRGLEAMVSLLGMPITNEYDCPLLMLNNVVFTVKTTEILRDISGT